MTTHFISGHLDLTIPEFMLFYAHRLEKAIHNGDDFVVGDAPGADTIAQWWLAFHIGPELEAKVTVFHMLDAPRNLVAAHGFNTRGGFTSDEERDRAMTEASDADIAWVRPGREKSGTAWNLARRSSER